MKVLSELVFIQVVGLLISAAVAETERPYPSTLSKIIYQFKRIQIDFAYTLDDDDFLLISDIPKEDCEKYGGPTAYDTAIEGVQEFNNSMSSLEDDQPFMFDTISEDYEVVIDVNCNITLLGQTNMNRLIDSTKPCFNPQNRTTLNVVQNVTTHLVKYVCENNADRIKEFVRVNGTTCLASHSQERQECGAALFPKDDVNLWGISKFTPNTEDCVNFELYQNCMMKLFKKCENARSSELLSGLMNILMKTSGCEDLLEIRSSATVNN